MYRPRPIIREAMREPTDGIVRLRYEEGPVKARLRRPGEVKRATGDIVPTANLCQKPGHRIGWTFRRRTFQNRVNPNHRRARRLAHGQRIARNTIFVDTDGRVDPLPVLAALAAAADAARPFSSAAKDWTSGHQEAEPVRSGIHVLRATSDAARTLYVHMARIS